MTSRNLLLLHGAAASGRSALQLLERGSLDAGLQAVDRARSQVDRIHEPPHSRRARIGRSMIERLDYLVRDARMGSDATRSFSLASAAVAQALEVREKSQDR